MGLYRELYQIATAKYGLQMKDPIYASFGKLMEDTKFNLLVGIMEDDVSDLNELLKNYSEENTTCKTLKNILDMIYILNGRQGFFAKSSTDEENIAMWIDKLANEFINSTTGYETDGSVMKGSGIVNAKKIRAAIYHIIDILQSNNSVVNATPEITLLTDSCFLGRDAAITGVYGVEGGLGEYMTITEYATLDHPAITISGYGFYLVLTDVYTGNRIHIPIIIGPEKLQEGEYAEVSYQLYTPIPVPYSLYRVNISYDDYSTEYVPTKLDIQYNAIRERIVPDINDYIYTLYGDGNSKAKTLYYKGEADKVLVPDIFVTGTLEVITSTTFCDTDVTEVYIQEGVTTIE